MDNRGNNYAFIDGQNLNLGIKSLGWSLDFKKFRIFLREKYNVSIAYYFIGYIPKNGNLYSSLRDYGYILIFKPVVTDGQNKPKGNIDADLVLRAMIDYDKFTKAVIVTSDGDFHCLVKYFVKNNKLLRIIVPNFKYSSLLRKFSNHIVNIQLFRNKLEKSQQKREAFPRDETLW